MNSELYVVPLFQELLRFDTQNFGEGVSHGETACARWIAERLAAVGVESVLVHREDAPERGNLIVRVPGSEPDLPGLVVQGHLDTVPADAAEWTVDPWGGVVRDGLVYGRGAADMKDMVACMLWTLLVWAVEGTGPRRDMVFAFVADEEDQGLWGAEWLVDAHPEFFDGCEAVIGEDGAQVFPAQASDGSTVRLYPIAVAERGTLHCEISTTGTPGHGSRPSGDDAVARLLRVVARVAEFRWPLQIPDAVRAQVAGMAAALGYEVDVDDEDSFAAFCRALGPDAAGPLPWTVRPSATPTVLSAGSSVNVIPSRAAARFDVRCPPGTFDSTRERLQELVGEDATLTFLTGGPPTESPVDTHWYRIMEQVVREFDPEGAPVPMCMGGGTDAKAFSRLGLLTYGFTPLGPDPQGRRPGGIHGIDEHNTVAGLETGARMLHRFLEIV